MEVLLSSATAQAMGQGAQTDPERQKFVETMRNPTQANLASSTALIRNLHDRLNTMYTAKMKTYGATVVDGGSLESNPEALGATPHAD
jgi:tellurite resistance protein